MKIQDFMIAVFAIVFSSNVNAVVVNTLNGIGYEWLELTETQNLTRAEVELLLSDSSSALYGYEYASRLLVADLFQSYATWSGISGYYGEPGIVAGVGQLVSDFGPTYVGPPQSPITTTTIDGYEVTYVSTDLLMGLYGTTDECGAGLSCFSQVIVNRDAGGTMVRVYQSARYGWDAAIETPHTTDYNTVMGSFLVRVVPIPATYSLFCFGLIMLWGFTRRKIP